MTALAQTAGDAFGSNRWDRAQLGSEAETQRFRGLMVRKGRRRAGHRLAF